MVKDPDRLLLLAYAGAKLRPKLELVFALDEALADILRTVREPMIAQIRLAWWRDQLEALAAGREAAPEPLLLHIGDILGPSGAASLVDLPSAWEHLLEDPLEIEAVRRFADLRSATLAPVFNSPALTIGLRYWALVDFAFHCSDPQLAAQVAEVAKRQEPDVLKPLPRSARVLIGLARDDVAHPEARRPGSPRRLLRAFRHAVLTS